MVAISITDRGVEVDPLSDVNIHPAAELFPLMRGAEFDELVADIREHGQRDPIVLTPDGLLLDGRNRWRACKAAGLDPQTRVEEAEPWAFVISTNVHRRHLNDSQRAMIAAKVARRPTGGDRKSKSWRIRSSYDDPIRPPTRSEVSDLLNVSGTAIDRARVVVTRGTVELQQAVASGAVPVYTAARVARDLPDRQQDEFAKRVTQGADPVGLAGALGVASDWKPAVGPARTDNRSPSRHQYLTVAALRSLSDSLVALDLVLQRTDGLDPSITSEEAAQWVGGLSKGRGSVRRVVNLLTERKESNQ